MNNLVKEEPLKKDIETLLEIFRRNVLKANFIWELKKEHIEKGFDQSLTTIFQELETSEGINNIARSQALVMLVTSFEAFTKDLFKIVINHKENVLKSILRKMESKWDSNELANIMNKPEIMASLIIKKQNLSFQNFDSLKRSWNFLGLNFEDECYTAEKEVKKYILKTYGQGILPTFNCLDLLKETFNVRHIIVHEGKTSSIQDFDLNTIMLCLQRLVVNLASSFSDIPAPLMIEKRFDIKLYRQDTENIVDESVDENKSDE